LSLSSVITNAVQESITYLCEKACIDPTESETHRIVTVTCWNQDDLTRQAVAKYLVGLRACAIDAALNIRAELEDTPEDRNEIVQSVIEIIGNSPDELTEAQKQTERNPWIAEGIWHLCITIAKDKPDIHPVGNILAVKPVNVSSKDHGLDIAAIYQVNDNLFGLSIIECKAYKNDPNKAINEAVSLFKKIDKGFYAPRIRQSIQLMRHSLPAHMQEMISTSLWKQYRSYIPNPHYDMCCAIDWANPRPSFNKLKPEKTNIIIMPHIISGFDEFFDSIANKMRDFVKSF